MPLPITPPDSPNDTDLDQPVTPNTGFMNRLKEAGLNFEDSELGNGQYFDPEKGLMEMYNPGPIVQQDNLPDSLKQQYPNGVGQNVVSMIEKENSHDQEVQRALSYMPTGAVRDVSDFTTGLLGQILSPSGAAMGAMPVEALPEAILSDAGSLGTKVGKMGIGAATGLGTQVAMNGMQMYYQHQLGNSMPMDTLLDNWGVGLGFGFLHGAIHSRVNPVSNVDPNVDKNTLNTAVSQMNADKPVNVDPLVQQAKYQTAATQSYDPVKSDNMIQNLQNTIEGRQDIEGNESNKTGTAPEVLSKALDILRNHNMASPEDLKWVDNIQNIPMYKDLITAVTNHPDLWSDEQANLVNNIQTDPEFEQKRNTQDYNDTLDNMNKLDDNISDGELQASALNDTVNQYKSGLQESLYKDDIINDDEAQKFSENLDNLSRVQQAVDAAKKTKSYMQDTLNSLKTRQEYLDNLDRPNTDGESLVGTHILKTMLDNEQAAKEWHESEPNTKEDILKAHSSLIDPNNDVSMNSSVDDREDEEIRTASQPDIKDSENKVNDLINQNLLDPELKEQIDNDHNDKSKILSQDLSHVDDYIKCVGEQNG
eukprot:GHVU01152186.1.p2 GENE.GHVU01152186.1~~GHVU01152186.1.p2  ORF type:complete len:593 (-),score=68.09 GHVU01152186.1:649-2427(-)